MPLTQNILLIALISSLLMHLALIFIFPYTISLKREPFKPKINFLGSILSPQELILNPRKNDTENKDLAVLPAVVYEKKIYGFEITKPVTPYTKKQIRTRPHNTFEENNTAEEKPAEEPLKETPYNKLSIDP